MSLTSYSVMGAAASAVPAHSELLERILTAVAVVLIGLLGDYIRKKLRRPPKE